VLHAVFGVENVHVGYNPGQGLPLDVHEQGRVKAGSICNVAGAHAREKDHVRSDEGCIDCCFQLGAA
jgi:hypothetical protein